ncbi:hypothetical protein [Nonomuraea zeae]|uniref:Uncharacterized protein n=1 Tax=Nonomuraea zeae TaxID=1642303 RepID=A0A5S4FQQ5_9ACTN|nr:hypothetical protein [Nonomuraea zeae]TMR23046.1 hypothetical protein ETD85_48545 [Nonomuraea zeae]
MENGTPQETRRLADGGRHKVRAGLMMAGLLTSAIVFGWIGGEDLSGALTFTGRVTGGLLFLASLTMFAAAAASVDYWGGRRLKYSGTILILGTFVVLAANLMMLIVQIQGRDITPFLACWLILLVWSGWAFSELCRQGIWRDLPHPRGLAAGVTVTAVAVAGNFVYTQMYLPHMSPTKIDLTTSFGKPRVHPKGDHVYLPLTISFKNIGDVEIYVVYIMYSLWGVRDEYIANPLIVADSVPRLGDRGWQLNRFSTTKKHELLSVNLNHIDPGTWVSPGETLVTEKLVMLPRNDRLDVVKANAEMYVVRTDKAKVHQPAKYDTSWGEDRAKAPPWLLKDQPKGTQFIRYDMPLKQPNKLLDLTRSPKQITVWWFSPPGDDAFPAGTFVYSRLGTTGEEFQEESAEGRYEQVDQYGFMWIVGTSDVTSIATETDAPSD